MSLVSNILDYRTRIKHPAHLKEDLTIARLLGDIAKGFYIDIGAHDPYRNSNSHPFYELGWRGIDVEPTKYWADRLKQEHPANTVIEAAAGAYNGFIEFHVPDVEPMHWQIATTKPAWVEHHKLRVPGEQWKTISVPQVTLNNVFAQANREVDFISIDVEGAELEVIKGWSIEVYQPKVICIESEVTAETPRWHEWEPMLLPFYNFAHFDSCNRFYTRK